MSNRPHLEIVVAGRRIGPSRYWHTDDCERDETNGGK
jgi:hypothetical protein